MELLMYVDDCRTIHDAPFMSAALDLGILPDWSTAPDFESL
jgi:hypothetical protein